MNLPIPPGEEANRPAAAPPAIAQLDPRQRFVPWLVSCDALTIAVSWAAFQLQQDGIAPAVLFPILVGTAFGGVAAGLARYFRSDWRAPQLIVVFLLAMVTVVGQDFFAYRRSNALTLERGPVLPAELMAEEGFAAPGFSHFLRWRIRSNPTWWALDAALTGAAGLITFALMSKKPRQPRAAEAVADRQQA